MVMASTPAESRATTMVVAIEIFILRGFFVLFNLIMINKFWILADLNSIFEISDFCKSRLLFKINCQF